MYLKNMLLTLCLGTALALPTISLADHVWVGVMAKGSGITKQGYDNRNYFNTVVDSTRARWKNDQNLIDLEYGYHRWVALFAKDTNSQSLVAKDDWKSFIYATQKRQKEGYALTDIGTPATS